MSNTGVSLSLRGNLPTGLSPSSSALSSQNTNHGLGSTGSLISEKIFKPTSSSVTMGYPGQASTSGTQTGLQQQGDLITKFTDVTGFEPAEFEKKLDQNFKDSNNNPSATAQNTTNEILKYAAVRKGMVLPDNKMDEIYTSMPKERQNFQDRLSNYLTTQKGNRQILLGLVKSIGPLVAEVNKWADAGLLPRDGLRRGGRKTFTRKYKNRKYKVSSKKVRKSSYKRNTYRNKRRSRRN